MKKTTIIAGLFIMIATIVAAQIATEIVTSYKVSKLKADTLASIGVTELSSKECKKIDDQYCIVKLLPEEKQSYELDYEGILTIDYTDKTEAQVQQEAQDKIKTLIDIIYEDEYIRLLAEEAKETGTITYPPAKIIIEESTTTIK